MSRRPHTRAKEITKTFGCHNRNRSHELVKEDVIDMS